MDLIQDYWPYSKLGASVAMPCDIIFLETILSLQSKAI